MADIRINDLATTASFPAADDFTEIDGATNGSRKLAIAAWVAAQRNALAPAQALVFDGTAGATMSFTVGSGDFGVFLDVNVGVISDYVWIIHGATNAFGLFVNPTTLTLQSSLSGIGDNTVSTGALIAGTVARVGYVKSGSTGTYFINGVAAGTTTDTRNYSAASTSLGGTSHFFVGTLRLIGIENRARSSAEALTLYQTGAPAAADINAVYNDANGASLGNPIGAGQAMISGSNSTFAAATGFWSLLGGTPPTISGGVMNFIDGSSYIDRVAFLKIGCQYTLLVGAKTGILVFDGGVAATVITAGTPITFTATQTTLRFFTAAGGTMDDVTLTPLGLLIAPDANAPGNGYQLRDGSGNKADITLPATGVDWLLKSETGSNQIRATLTWAGTHEAKSLLGQIALTTKDVITSIITEATVASSGSGCTVGSVTTPALFVAANAFTTSREVHTLAAQLPAGSATNDLSLVIDPDTANYTGTIQVWVNYTRNA